MLQEEEGGKDRCDTFKLIGLQIVGTARLICAWTNADRMFFTRE